jgi:hypothetical protein
MVRDYDPTNNYNNLLDRVIRHRDAIISHLNWVCIFLGFHSFGLTYSPPTVLLQSCFEKSLNMGKNKKTIFSVNPMPNADSISQFIFQCFDNTAPHFFVLKI